MAASPPEGAYCMPDELALSRLLDEKTDQFLDEGDKILSGEPAPAPAPAEPKPAEPVQAAETPSAPEAATPPAEPPKSEAAVSTPAAERKAYQDFLSKHGGDPEKGSQHYFEVMTQNAKLKRELDEAKTASAQPAKPVEPVSPPPPAEVPALVAKLDQSILALSTEFNSVEATLGKINEVYPQWTTRRDQLIERLETLTDPDQIAQTQRDLRETRAGITRLESSHADFMNRRGRLIRDYEIANTQKEVAQQLHEERKARTTLESASEERVAAEWRKGFFSTIDNIASSKGIPEADREDFRDEVEKAAAYKVRVQDEEIADLSSFITERADRFVARQRRVAAAYAQAKITDAKPAAPQGKAAVVPAPAKRPSPKSLEELASNLDDQWARESV